MQSSAVVTDDMMKILPLFLVILNSFSWAGESEAKLKIRNGKIILVFQWFATPRED